MHKCLKCGRKILDIAEIADGCGCGSKVFVFIKGEDAPSMAHGSHIAVIDFKAQKGGKKETDAPNQEAPANPEIALANDEFAGPGAFAAKRADGAEAASNPIVASDISSGKPDATPAGNILQEEALSESLPHDEVWLAKGGSVKSISTGGIENIRQVAKGVFELDVGALGAGPLVIRDENGIYYVRLPFSQGTQSEDQIQ